MIAKEQSPRFSISPLHIIIIIVILQLLITLLTDGFAFSFDEAIWHYIGRNWFRHGLTPYAGGVDNKSPLIFAIYGLSDQLFGVNYWFPRVLGTLIEGIGLYYIFKIANHIGGRLTGILALSMYGLSLLWRSTDGKLVSLTETYAITIIIVAFYRYLTAQKNKDVFISGLIAGLGAGFRLSALFGIGAILIASLRHRTSAILFPLGVLSGIIILATLGILSGINMHDFITYALTDNFGAGSPTDHSLLWKLEQFVNGFFYSELILFYPAVVGYFLIKKRNRAVTIWLVCEFIGINLIAIYARPHFKNLLPPLSLASAISISWLVENYKLPARQVLLIIWIVFFPKLLDPLVSLKKIFLSPTDKSGEYCTKATQPDDYSKKMLGLWIRSNTNENDNVLVAGYGALVQAYSERISPSVYFNVTQTKRAKERFVNDISMNKPGMIVVPVFSDYRQLVSLDIRTVIDELIAKDYLFDTCMYGYNIYRVKNINMK